MTFMNRPDSLDRIKITTLLAATLVFLVAGCAPPPASNALQQRIDELLKVQQEQARQLEQLQQKLAGLDLPQQENAPPAMTDQATNSENAGQEVAASAQMRPQIPSTEEITALSESAALYLESFAAIATGRMAAAKEGFSNFISRFPDHEYVGNARYWLAEALLALHENQRGESLLLDIIDTPTQQHKAPAAMARLVTYYQDSGASANANSMLEMLRDRYPESAELKRLLRSEEPR